MPAPIRIQPPTAMRVYTGLFGLFWCGFVLVALVAMLIDLRPEALFFVLMLAFGGTISYRMFRMEAVADVEGLLVRNYMRTKRYRWSEIEGFRLASPSFGMPFGKTIYALLANGEMTSLDVTMQMGLLPGGRRKRDAYLTQLRQWTDEAK